MEELELLQETRLQEIWLPMMRHFHSEKVQALELYFEQSTDKSVLEKWKKSTFLKIEHDEQLLEGNITLGMRKFAKERKSAKDENGNMKRHR